MNNAKAFVRRTELDRTTWPDFRDGMNAADAEGTPTEPRSYPGYPRWPLARVRPRRWTSLDRTLLARRCVRKLDCVLPRRPVLSRLLQTAHGITAELNRGPTPSAGGLQAVELYLVNWAPAWLPAGLYHYDRIGHHLSQVADRAERKSWEEMVPALHLIDGGAFLWVLVGDGERVTAKYGERGYRFLLLEAGHLMQNLCLVSASLGLTTVPLGGCFEREIGRAFSLPPNDVVLYLAVCGISQAP